MTSVKELTVQLALECSWTTIYLWLHLPQLKRVKVRHLRSR